MKRNGESSDNADDNVGVNKKLLDSERGINSVLHPKLFIMYHRFDQAQAART